MKITVPVSVGELYDKIGILVIKMNKVKGEDLTNIINEYNSLMKVFDKNFNHSRIRNKNTIKKPDVKLGKF